MIYFHRIMAVVWVLNVPVAVATDLKGSITYLVFVSLMTAFSGEMAAAHGASVRRAQKAQEE